jgi:hypothetical protein
VVLLDTFLRIMAWSAGRPTRWVRRARGWLRAWLVRDRTEQVRTVACRSVTKEFRRTDGRPVKVRLVESVNASAYIAAMKRAADATRGGA